MGPRWRVRLSLLVGVGAAAVVALATNTFASGTNTFASGTNTTPRGSVGCATGSWPAGTRFIAVPRPASARVSFTSDRWRLWLRPGRNRALTGRVLADAAVSSVRATGSLRSRLRHTARKLSFLLPAGSTPSRLSFVARCAHQIAFDLAGAQVLIGRQPAPTQSFQVQRPPTTGVSGRLIAGPTCPVIGPGTNCPPANGVQGTVQIATAPTSRSSPGATLVKTVATDSSGNFSTDLAPGDYTLSATAAGPQPPAGTMSRASTVQVDAGVVSEVTLAFDTGIR